MPISEAANRWNKSEIGRKWRSEYRKRKRLENPEKTRIYDRERYRRNKDHHKDYNLRTLYGISYQDKLSIYEEQKRSCAICNKPKPENKLHVDHDHLTGKVRGLLCNRCNVTIGMAMEDSTILSNAIRYLAKNNYAFE